MTDLAPITDLERIVNPLETISDTSTIDELDEAIGNARGVLARMKDYLKTCQEEYEREVLAIIEVRGKFQLGEIRYSKGVKRTQKQAAPKEILMAISDKTGGDFDKITNCLSSACFKPAACKEILGKNSKLFWTQESDKLNTAVLKVTNTAFLNEGKK